MSPEAGRLLWRCRRGVRELDQLLLAYLRSGYPAASEAERSAFLELLELPNDHLMGYLLGVRRSGEGPVRQIVEQIRRQLPV